jgi:putative glutamine amidotransferase
MTRPLIGITAHRLPAPLSRSALVQRYIDAIEAAGGAPVGIPMGLCTASLERVYSVLDGILLPGGDDVAPERYGHERHPALGSVDEDRDELEMTMAEWAMRDDKPVLGICRGIQVLAVAGGGTLFQDLPSENGSELPHDVREFGFDFLSHRVIIEEGTLLHRAIGRSPSEVNSFHHQAVRDIPPGFVVSARSDDGVVEGIEAPDKLFAVGVQCHPEGMWRTTAPDFRGLFEAFVLAAERSNLRPDTQISSTGA